MVVKLQTDNIDLFDGLILLAAAVDPKEEKPERWRYMMNIPPLKYLLPGAYRPSNTELVYLKKDLKELDKEWENISCPVWIIHGDKDTYVPVANVDYAKKKLTKARSVEVKILPGADHFIPNWAKAIQIIINKKNPINNRRKSFLFIKQTYKENKTVIKALLAIAGRSGKCIQGINSL